MLEKNELIQVNNTTMKDDIPDGHQKAEIVRAKQDMMNRIIQMEEKVNKLSSILYYSIV